MAHTFDRKILLSNEGKDGNSPIFSDTPEDRKSEIETKKVRTKNTLHFSDNVE